MTARLAAALAIAAIAALMAPATVLAHATLEGTTPDRGARLERSPAEVVMRFDESVNASLGAVRVFGPGGREVQKGGAFHPGGHSNQVAVRLPADLPDGGYTATYRVISADSHPVSGGFTFTIGNGAASATSVADLLRGQTAGPVTSTAFSVVRGLEYAAIALGLGAVVFLLACWLPALPGLAGPDAAWAAATAAFAARSRLLLLIAAAAGIVAGLLAIGLEGAVGEGTSLWSAATPSIISDVLGTRFGVTWLLGIIAWLVTGGAVLLSSRAVPALRPASVGATGLALPSSRRAVVLLAVPLGALAFLPAVSGHAGAQTPVAVLLPANVIHVASMAAWLGGIAMLVLAVRTATSRLEPHDRTALLVNVVSRFSTLAGIAFALLFLSGTIQGLIEVASIHALVDTAFGRAVLIKLVLFGILVALGWSNRFRALPALRAAGDEPLRAGVLLRRTLRAELALGVVVLAVTGALAGYPPSTAVSQGPVTREADVGPAHLQLTVDPASPGVNELHVYLFDRKSGAQFDGAKEVTATAALPSKRIAAIPLDLRTAGPGHLTGSGSFGVTGDWRMTVTVRVSEFDEYAAHLTIPIR